MLAKDSIIKLNSDKPVFSFSVKIAIELIEEGSMAVGDMMMTLLFPLVPFCCEVVVILWFCLVAMFLASAGEQTYMVNVEECEDDEGMAPFFLNVPRGPIFSKQTQHLYICSIHRCEIHHGLPWARL